jgi:hypothetical protein
VEKQLKADPNSPKQFLQQNGYVFMRNAIPIDLCQPLCDAIETEMEMKLSQGSCHQEEPCENFSASTRKLLQNMQQWVIEHILKKKIGGNVSVPSWWPETLYGRLKKEGFLTRWHSDALNTVIERELLADYKVLETRQSLATSSELAWYKGDVDGAKDSVFPGAKQLPIFTFWVCLRSLHSLRQSHLRLHVGSHVLPNIGVVRSKPKKKTQVEEAARINTNEFYQTRFRGLKNITTVQVRKLARAPFTKPLDYSYTKLVDKTESRSQIVRVSPLQYKYKHANFSSPSEPFQVGDIVVFHCLTQHEATVHNDAGACSKGNKRRRQDSDQSNRCANRVSMDGRVLMELS